MEKETQPQDNNFTTLDAYLSGFLVLKGFRPSLVKSVANSKIIFVFRSTPKLFESISQYGDGSKVEAVKFSTAIKALKSQIHSIRSKDNDQSRESRGYLSKFSGRNF
jgi:Domain of unknown function (DUF5659)